MAAPTTNTVPSFATTETTILTETDATTITAAAAVEAAKIVECQDCTFYIYVCVASFGIIVLIIIIINLIVCCCCCPRKRRRRKRPRQIPVDATTAIATEVPNEIIIQQQQQEQQQNPDEKQTEAENGNTPGKPSTEQNGLKPKTNADKITSKDEKNNMVASEKTAKSSTKTKTRRGGKKAGTTDPPTVQNLNSTQPSLSLDITQPKTESEMTPDELEYLAFSILDSGKRFRIFNAAVKMAEKIAESHGFWINDRDPTVPGDEEAWLQKDADNIVRACVEIHGVPVPDFGANKSEYLDFIEKHSLREIYQIALYTEVDDIIRLFFLNAVIERFREVVRKLPVEQLEKCQHPIPLLYRIYKEQPNIFEFKPKKHEKPPKKQKK